MISTETILICAVKLERNNIAVIRKFTFPRFRPKYLHNKAERRISSYQDLIETTRHVYTCINYTTICVYIINAI